MNEQASRYVIHAAAQSEFMRHTSDMVFLKDLNGVYLGSSSPFAAATLAKEPAALVGKTDFDLFQDQELARRYVDDDARLLAAGKPMTEYVEPYSVEDGHQRYCLTSKYILRDEAGKPLGILGVSRDITRQYMAQQDYENELRSLFSLPQDGLMAMLFDVTDWRVVDFRYRDGQDRVLSRYGTMDEYIRAAADSVCGDEAASRFFRELDRGFLLAEYEKGRRNRSLEYLRRMADGSERWIRCEMHFLQDPVNGHTLLFALLRDVDDSRRAYSALVYAAENDAVTGLLNRGGAAGEAGGVSGGAGAGPGGGAVSGGPG